ncbi:hypothetical protein [Persicitalea sp.]|uniref:hypothetical protein n=1 Tax=Persicitalea sp. TaxID=3100273 RepID=UPI0035934764
MALVDARARAIDQTHFFKELVFSDFSETRLLGDAYLFDNVAFIDNGQIFDLAAGDGIYTAVTTTPYNELVQAGSLTGLQPNSVAKDSIVDPDFKKQLLWLITSPGTFKTHPLYPTHGRRVAWWRATFG